MSLSAVQKKTAIISGTILVVTFIITCSLIGLSFGTPEIKTDANVIHSLNSSTSAKSEASTATLINDADASKANSINSAPGKSFSESKGVDAGSSDNKASSESKPVTDPAAGDGKATLKAKETPRKSSVSETPENISSSISKEPENNSSASKEPENSSSASENPENSSSVSITPGPTNFDSDDSDDADDSEFEKFNFSYDSEQEPVSSNIEITGAAYQKDSYENSDDEESGGEETGNHVFNYSSYPAITFLGAGNESSIIKQTLNPKSVQTFGEIPPKTVSNDQEIVVPLNPIQSITSTLGSESFTSTTTISDSDEENIDVNPLVDNSITISANPLSSTSSTPNSETKDKSNGDAVLIPVKSDEEDSPSGDPLAKPTKESINAKEAYTTTIDNSKDALVSKQPSILKVFNVPVFPLIVNAAKIVFPFLPIILPQFAKHVINGNGFGVEVDLIKIIENLYK